MLVALHYISRLHFCNSWQKLSEAVTNILGNKIVGCMKKKRYDVIYIHFHYYEKYCSLTKNDKFVLIVAPGGKMILKIQCVGFSDI